jgi:phosphinothricin acetyltransferase
MKATDPVAIRPAEARDLAAINGIYDHDILHGTATWDEAPWTLEQRQEWFAEHDGTTPVLVAEVEGKVAGFAYLSWYRPKTGYRYTREDTIYIDEAFRGKGIGNLLLNALLERARALDLRCIIGVITSDNATSIALHRRYGFEDAGTTRQVGYKFGRWLDSVTMQLLLPGGPL